MTHECVASSGTCAAIMPCHPSMHLRMTQPPSCSCLAHGCVQTLAIVRRTFERNMQRGKNNLALAAKLEQYICRCRR